MNRFPLRQLALLFLLVVFPALTGCFDFDGKLGERLNNLKDKENKLKNMIRSNAKLLDLRDKLHMAKRELEMELEIMRQRLVEMEKK